MKTTTQTEITVGSYVHWDGRLMKIKAMGDGNTFLGTAEAVVSRVKEDGTVSKFQSIVPISQCTLTEAPKPASADMATARPRKQNGACIKTEGGNTIAECPQYGAGLVSDGEIAPWNKAEANAALIVRAVNAHDELVAALRDCKKVMEIIPKNNLPASEQSPFLNALIGARNVLEHGYRKTKLSLGVVAE